MSGLSDFVRPDKRIAGATTDSTPAKRQKSEKASQDKLKHADKNNSTRTFRYQTEPQETSGASLPDFIPPVKTEFSQEDLCPNNLSLTVKIKDESTKLMRNPTTILLEQAQKDKVSPPKVEITSTGPFFYATIQFRGKQMKLETPFKKKDNAKHFAATQMLMKVYGLHHDWKPTGIDHIENERKEETINLPTHFNTKETGFDESLYKRAHQSINPNKIDPFTAISQRVTASRNYTALAQKNAGTVKSGDGSMVTEFVMTISKNQMMVNRGDRRDLVVRSFCRTKQEARAECIKKIIVAVFRDLGGA